MDCSVNKYSLTECVYPPPLTQLFGEKVSLQGALNMLALGSLDMAFCIRVTCSFCLPFTIEIVNLWLFGKTAPNIIDHKSGSISFLKRQRQCLRICNDGHNKYHKFACVPLIAGPHYLTCSTYPIQQSNNQPSTCMDNCWPCPTQP